MYVVSGYKIYGQEQVIAQSACIGNYYIDEQKFEELKAFTVKAGDILMSLVGTLGKVLVVPKNHEAGIINPRLVKMTFVPQKASSIFFKHLLASILIQNQIAQGTQGGTMGVLNGTILKEINIVLPPINEQIKIADILDGIDRKLSAAKVKLAKAKDLKQGLMNDLLTGKVRVKI
jgi:type I restriction enzyme S subunit